MTTKKKQISGKSKASKPAKPSTPTKATMDDLPETHEKLTTKEIARRKAEKKRLLQGLEQLLNTEIDHAGNKVVTGTEEVAGQQIPCATTHYKDDSTSKRYGNDAFQLIRDRNGKWFHQYDYGKVSIDNKISQGTGYMSDEEYARLRYAMSLIEGVRRGHMESKAALNEFVINGVINSTNAPEVISKANKMLDQVINRDLENECENEWIMLSIAVLANKLDRPPTKVEARKFHISHVGVTYPTSAAFRQQLKVIGATWLPAGVRGEARSK